MCFLVLQNNYVSCFNDTWCTCMPKHTVFELIFLSILNNNER